MFPARGRRLAKRVGISIACFFVIGFLAFFWVMTELVLGPVCSNWRSSMTREEKILLVLKGVNELEQVSFELEDSRPKVAGRYLLKQIPYRGPRTILRDQPDCCILVSSESLRAGHPTENVPSDDEGVVILRYVGTRGDLSFEGTRTVISMRVDLNLCKPY